MSMKTNDKIQIIYLGNCLSKHGFTPTTVEILGDRLKESFALRQASDKRNYILRMLDMWKVVLFATPSTILLIDTYSTLAFHFAWTSGLLARWRRLKYIPILHGGNLPNRFKKHPLLSRLYLKNAAAIVSPSGYLKEAVEKKFKLSADVIPNFIDLSNYPSIKKKMDTPRLLWVRSFHEIYNPTLAIKILRGLKDKGFEDVTLCMIGPDKDGSLQQVIELAKKMKVEDAIEITGRLSKGDWINKSAKYNIFINTTNFDNTPVSVMEAMSLGFPVITTKVGGIPFLFIDEKEGIMVEPDNASAFISKIKWLFENKENAALISKNAREKATQWDWAIVEKQWISLVEKISKDHR